MDGLFQLLIIVLFVMAAVFDAVKRSREREQKKEEMEAAEAGDAGDREAEPQVMRRESTSRQEREEVSAETMVPEDLWAILTGQEQASRPREEPAEPEPEPAPAPASVPEPAPRAEPSPEPETRRSTRWVAGLDRVAEEEAAAFGGLDEPWDQFDDISQGEIDDGEGEVVAGPLSPYAKRGRGPAGRYRPALEGVDDLRRAIVLKEVLGPPIGFREDDLR